MSAHEKMLDDALADSETEVDESESTESDNYLINDEEATLTAEEASQGYGPIVRAMTSSYGLKIKRWRRAMSGCAWRVSYQDGRCVGWVESPFPKTPISLAIFLHEVGHHVIGFNRYKRRCEEEYHAWLWAMDQMRRYGVAPDEKVKRRFEASMQYAVGKAIRRGLKQLPEPLMRFAA